MQILIIEENEDLLNILSMGLKLSDDIEVIPRHSISDSKGFVDILPDLKLIVINNTSEFKQRLDLIDHVLTNCSNIELIVVSGTLKIDHPRLTLIDRIEDPKKLFSLVFEKFSVDFLSQEEAAYAPIEIEYLKYFNVLPVSIFLKLSDGENKRFVKVLNRDDVLPNDFIRKYNLKGVSLVYLTNDEKDKFSKSISKLFLEYFKQKSEKKEITFEAFEDIHKKTFDQLIEQGFSPMSTKLAAESVGDLLYTINKSDGMSSLLKHLYMTKASYAYRFSYMSALVGHSLVGKFTWATDTIKSTIIFAALFSDIGLSEEELKLRTEEELNGANLSEEAKKKLYNHALVNSNEIKKYKGIPEEVPRTILHHHGSRNGLGFPQNISSSLTNLGFAFLFHRNLYTIP